LSVLVTRWPSAGRSVTLTFLALREMATAS
jgi:hypothetical protein